MGLPGCKGVINLELWRGVVGIRRGDLKLLRGVVRRTTGELPTDSHNYSNP